MKFPDLSVALHKGCWYSQSPTYHIIINLTVIGLQSDQF